MCDFLQRFFYRLYPSSKKESTSNMTYANWLRCVCLIATITHFTLIIFCLAFCGFGPMAFNFFQAAFAYSCYLTLREREMIVYIILLVGQIIYCSMKLLNGGEDGEPAAATQTGGYIGNIVAAAILLYMSIRAEWLFNSTGGLRGNGLTK